MLVFAKIKLNFVKNTSGRTTGSYGVTVALVNGNYAWSDGSTSPLTYTYTIDKKEITVQWNVGTYVYSGNPQGPTATASGLVSGDTLTLTVTGIETNAGNHTATVAAFTEGNYKLSANSTQAYTINHKEITVQWTVGTYEYNGSPQGPTATATGLIGEDTIDLTVTGYGTAAGNHTATVASFTEGNYKLSANSTQAYTINHKEITIVWTVGTYEYSGSPQGPTATASGLIGNDTLTLTVTGYGTNVGNHTATVKAFTNGNYTLLTDSTKGYTISQKEITVQWNVGTYEYNGKPQGPTATANGLVGNDTLALTVTGYGTNAGSHTATVVAFADGNYKLTSNSTQSYTINKKSLTLGNINLKNKIYDGTTAAEFEAVMTVTGFVDSDGVSYTAGNATANFIDANAYYATNGLVQSKGAIIVLTLNNDNGNYVTEYTIDRSKTNGTITSRTIMIDNSVYAQHIYDSGKLTYDKITASALSTYAFTYINTKDTNYQFSPTIKYMHNGMYYYGTDPKIDGITSGAAVCTNVIGSTYKVVIGLTYNKGTLEGYTSAEIRNYTLLEGSDYIIFKYKTAQANGTAYTIEDAILEGSGTTTLYGNATSATSYVTTSFTKITGVYSSTSFNISGRTLLVPYTNGTGIYELSNGTTAGNVYSALIVTDNVTLNFSGSAYLNVGAKIGYKQPNSTIVTQRGVLMNYGTINVASGCTVNAYGFIKGSGKLILANGATAVDCLRTYDFPGGTAGSSMYGNVFPANAWTAHNISCETKIMSGAKYQGFVYVSLSIVGDQKTTATVIGKAGATGCFFTPVSDGDANTYIVRTTENLSGATDLDTIVGKNQIAGQKENYSMYGTWKDSTFTMSMGSWPMKIEFTTSTTKPAPFSYADVTIKSGAELTLKNSSYMFMPGTMISIEENAELIVDGASELSMMTTAQLPASGDLRFGLYCKELKNAYIDVYGTLTVNGAIGGTINPKATTARLNINGEASSDYRSMNSTADPYYVSGAVEATGSVVDGEGNITNTITKSFYEGVSVSDGFAWKSISGLPTYTIVQHLMDGTTINTAGTTKSLKYAYADANSPPTITSSDIAATEREHYTFLGWYTDANYSTAFTSQTVENGGEYHVYAKWEYIEYTVTYVYLDDPETNNVMNLTGVTNSSSTSYTVIDALTLSDANHSEYNIFDGWYVFNPLEQTYVWVGSNKSVGVAGSEIGGYTLNTDLTFYAYMTKKETYTLKYMYQDTGGNWQTVDGGTVVEDTTVSALYDLANILNINANTSVQYYYEASKLGGWYLNQDGTGAEITTGTPMTSDIATNDVITLYAVRYDKYKVTRNYCKGSYSTTSNTTDSLWLMPGAGLAAVDWCVNTTDTYKQIMNFTHWTDSNGETVDKVYESTNGTKVMTITAAYSPGDKYWKVTLTVGSDASKISITSTANMLDTNNSTNSSFTYTSGTNYVYLLEGKDATITGTAREGFLGLSSADRTATINQISGTKTATITATSSWGSYTPKLTLT